MEEAANMTLKLQVTRMTSLVASMKATTVAARIMSARQVTRMIQVTAMNMIVTRIILLTE